MNALLPGILSEKIHWFWKTIPIFLHTMDIQLAILALSK